VGLRLRCTDGRTRWEGSVSGNAAVFDDILAGSVQIGIADNALCGCWGGGRHRVRLPARGNAAL